MEKNNLKDNTGSLLLILFTVLSLNLHLLGVLGLKVFSSKVELEDSNEALQIEVIEKSDKPQSFVSSPEEPLEDKVKQLKNKADFLSKSFKRVQEQTVANQTGLTANRFPLKKTVPTQQQDQQQDQQQNNNKRPRDKMSSDINKPTQYASNNFSINTPPSYLPQGVSTINEYIPNVKKGYFTSLNTDKFTYYSFFSRINEQVRPRWENQLSRFRRKLTRQQLMQLINKDYSTSIEIILDEKGYMKEARVLKSSGLPQMDEAPILAFEMASPFLNPPKDLINSDGVISLKYGFMVQWSR